MTIRQMNTTEERYFCTYMYHVCSKFELHDVVLYESRNKAHPHRWLGVQYNWCTRRPWHAHKLSLPLRISDSMTCYQSDVLWYSACVPGIGRGPGGMCGYGAGAGRWEWLEERKESVWRPVRLWHEAEDLSLTKST